MKTTQEYVSTKPEDQRYVIAYIREGGGANFNSVNDEGKFVKFYSSVEIVDFSDLPILEESDLSIVEKAGLLAAAEGDVTDPKKVVMSERVAQELGYL